MGLLEYIKKNYRNPNVRILRDLGASEVLIDYLVKTSHKTIWSVAQARHSFDRSAVCCSQYEA